MRCLHILIQTGNHEFDIILLVGFQIRKIEGLGGVKKAEKSQMTEYIDIALSDLVIIPECWKGLYQLKIFAA